MLWKNCQDVDSQRQASTYVYCSENLSNLGDKKKKRKRKEGKEQKKEKKIGRNTSVRKDSIKAPRQRHVLIQRQFIIVLDGSSKTRLFNIGILEVTIPSEFRN